MKFFRSINLCFIAFLLIILAACESDTEIDSQKPTGGIVDVPPFEQSDDAIVAEQPSRPNSNALVSEGSGNTFTMDISNPSCGRYTWVVRNNKTFRPTLGGVIRINGALLDENLNHIFDYTNDMFSAGSGLNIPPRVIFQRGLTATRNATLRLGITFIEVNPLTGIGIPGSAGSTGATSISANVVDNATGKKTFNVRGCN